MRDGLFARIPLGKRYARRALTKEAILLTLKGFLGPFVNKA